MIPFSGIDYIVHASTNILAGIEIKREKNEIEIKHLIKAIFKDLNNLELYTEVLSPLEKKKIIITPLKIDKLNKDNFKEIIQKEKIEFSDPLVIIVNIKGENIEEKYFDFYSGSYGYGDNIQQDMVTPVYKISRIPKEQKLMKPEKIKRVYDDEFDVFFMKGLFSENYKIEKVLEKLKNKFKVNCEYGYYSIGIEGPRITYFPFDYDEIMKKDVIILGNVNLECLGNVGIEILNDYVRNGGNIIILGGHVSYGGSGLKGSPLYDILPIEINSSPFDIKLNKNSYLIFDKEFFKEIKLKNKLYSPYMHKVKVKENSDVLIRTNKGEPFLIYKKLKEDGKIFCIIGAPFEYNKMKIFFNTSEWEEIMEKIFLEIKGG